MHLIIPLLLCSLAASVQAKAPGPIIFSELMWMGSTTSSADEWVELYNCSDTEVNLAGWTITRLTKDGEEIMVQIPEGKIAPQTTFLIANYAPDNSRSQLAAVPQLVDAAVALPNTKLQLRLFDGDPENGGKLMDVADDGTGAPLAGDKDLKYAMVRVLFDQEGSQPASWATAQETDGWDKDATERGTPGLLPAFLRPTPSAEPSSSTTQVQPATWAALKISSAGK